MSRNTIHDTIDQDLLQQVHTNLEYDIVKIIIQREVCITHRFTTYHHKNIQQCQGLQNANNWLFMFLES
jgi:hypothetical protein